MLKKIDLALAIALVFAINSCNEAGFQTELASNKHGQESLSSNAQADEANSQAHEPIMVAGSFVGARCGEYGPVDGSFGCGIHEDGAKFEIAQVTNVSIEIAQSIIPLEIQELAALEPWHVQFKLPLDLLDLKALIVHVEFEIAGQKYELIAEDGLSGELLQVVDTSASSLIFSLSDPQAVWFNDFTSPPQSLDVNQDGIPDWRLISNNGQAPKIERGFYFTGNGVGLASQNIQVSPNQMSVDFSVQSLEDPEDPGAEIEVNLSNSSRSAARIRARAEKRDDGSQIFSVFAMKDDGSLELLETVQDLPNRLVRVGLLLSASEQTVRLNVDGRDLGVFSFEFVDFEGDAPVVLPRSDVLAAFGHIHIATKN